MAALVELPHRGVLLSSHALHRRRPVGDDRPGRDLRPRRGDDELPDAGGGGGAGQQHPLWAGGQRLERERQPDARRRAAAQGRYRLGQLHQRLRCRRGIRRLPGERSGREGREGMLELPGRAGLAATPAYAHRRVRHEGNRHRPGASIAPPQKCHRPGSGAPRLGLQPAGTGCRWGRRRRGRAGQPEGHPERGGGGARRERVGPGHGARASPGPLLPGREPRRAARNSRRGSAG